MFAGRHVVSGPAADSITILQPLGRHATGYLEFAVENGDWQQVDAAAWASRRLLFGDMGAYDGDDRSCWLVLS